MQELFALQMLSFYEHIERDIILEHSINSTLEICDNKDIVERLNIADENLEDTCYCIYSSLLRHSHKDTLLYDTPLKCY